MLGKIQFAMVLMPDKAPVLYTNPVQVLYEDTGYEPAMHDYYNSRFLGDDILCNVVQAVQVGEGPTWELYCDDDFLGKQLPFNANATVLARTAMLEIYIAGPVVAFFRCDPRQDFRVLFPWHSIGVLQHEDVPDGLAAHA
jgi:hypothetical protein